MKLIVHRSVVVVNGHVMMDDDVVGRVAVAVASAAGQRQHQPASEQEAVQRP